MGAGPTVLVVPPQLEEKALYVAGTQMSDGGGFGPPRKILVAKTAELIVTPYVAG